MSATKLIRDYYMEKILPQSRESADALARRQGHHIQQYQAETEAERIEKDTGIELPSNRRKRVKAETLDKISRNTMGSKVAIELAVKEIIKQSQSSADAEKKLKKYISEIRSDIRESSSNITENATLNKSDIENHLMQIIANSSSAEEALLRISGDIRDFTSVDRNHSSAMEVVPTAVERNRDVKPAESHSSTGDPTRNPTNAPTRRGSVSYSDVARSPPHSETHVHPRTSASPRSPSTPAPRRSTRNRGNRG